jgi:hypothetical protein
MEAPEFVIPIGLGERYLIAVWFELPFCLYLPHGHYEVRMAQLNEGRPALIQLDKKTRPREARFAMLPPGEGEMWRDRRGTFRYSSAIIYMPYSDAASPDLEKMMDFMPTQTYLSYAIEYMNRLLRVYRLVTGDYYIPALAIEDIWHYFGVGIADAGSQPVQMRYMPMGVGEPEVNLLPDKRPDEVGEIKEMLRTEAPIPDEEELLMSARDFLDTGSPRLAVVEVETAFEVVVDRFVARYYRELGCSNEKIAKILKCGFENLIRDHLSAKIKPFAEGMPVYDNWLMETYKPRCDLVHGERLQVTEEEAEKAIRRVEEALEYLTGRPHDTIWPPKRPSLRITFGQD